MSTTAVKLPLHKLSVQTKRHFLRLYRGLLREATYLPDPQARKYWTDYVTARFAAYHPRSSLRLPTNGKNYIEGTLSSQARPIYTSRRATSLLQSCRSHLRLLTKANDGYPDSIITVLRHTYGRIGKRKYELLQPYLSPDAPADDLSLEQLIANRSLSTFDETSPDHSARKASVTRQEQRQSSTSDGHPRGKIRRADKALKENTAENSSAKPAMNHKTKAGERRIDNRLPISEALRAITTAQKSQPQTAIPGPPLRRADPVIPAENAWGRPMPLRRVRNMKKNALNELISKIMPPLPRQEWEKLGELALGNIPSNTFVKRRSGSSGNERGRSSFYQAKGHTKGPRELTRRSMKRHWTNIFAQCPVLGKDSKGRWVAEFGRINKDRVPAASEKDTWFFDSVDMDQRPKGFWSEYNRLHPNNTIAQDRMK